MNKKRVLKILNLLEEEYPHPHIALHFRNPLELLIATMLSAQCTDAQVNRITPKLFRKYRSVRDYSNADLGELEQDIRSAGFYKNKARNIIAAAKMIMSDFDGRVPDTMEELTKLPGVARKTANIVLANAFNKVVGIAVDTHVARLSQRLGFSKNRDPNKIEQDLMKLIPKEKWYELNYLLIDHGRAVCRAKKPNCPACVLRKLCPSAPEFLKEYYS